MRDTLEDVFNFAIMASLAIVAVSIALISIGGLIMIGFWIIGQ